MHPDSTIISQEAWTKVVIKLSMLDAKVGHMDGGVKNWLERLFEEYDRQVQECLDAFELRITR